MLLLHAFFPLLYFYTFILYPAIRLSSRKSAINSVFNMGRYPPQANIKLQNCEQNCTICTIWSFQVVKILRTGSSNFGSQNVLKCH